MQMQIDTNNLQMYNSISINISVVLVMSQWWRRCVLICIVWECL